MQLIGRFGTKLAIYNRYETLFSSSVHFNTALTETYMDAIQFLGQARDTFLRKGMILVNICVRSDGFNIRDRKLHTMDQDDLEKLRKRI